MILITLLFIGLFFASWKAPAWVKEIGIGALVVGVFGTLLGFLQAADAIQSLPGDVDQCVIAGGIKVALVPVLYGLVVYFVSLILRVVNKPRI
ncbi:MAG: MotA/TolQ/ExbB proton channel family protein [Bacteroidales bacterium]|nr:MotA/TolQ/ExbB proton channel family protein [Bacteroidales bacterium]